MNKNEALLIQYKLLMLTVESTVALLKNMYDQVPSPKIPV